MERCRQISSGKASVLICAWAKFHPKVGRETSFLDYSYSKALALPRALYPRMTASPPTSQPPPVASPSSSPNPNPNPSGPPPPNAPSLGSTSKPTPPTAPLPPLTGFQSALEHTGIPRSVLTWKPRLPSRNWSIFLTISGTLLYLWYDDRKQCRLIREETLRKVEYLGKQPMTDGSLGEVRKVKVYGARWPEDGDDDRALRHFRKYMKVSGVFL